jgi:hypothetical protein
MEDVPRIILLSFVLSIAAASPAAAGPTGRVGVMVDAGIPDGVHGSLLLRPQRWLQLHAGTGTNLVSLGFRAGASVFLLPTRVSPSINLEAGHYMSGSANNTMNRLGLTEGADHPMLRQVGYDYGNLHLGLDLGRDRVSFYLHGGVSLIRGTLRGLEEALTSDRDGVEIEVRQDPTFTLIAPSARIGVLFLF